MSIALLLLPLLAASATSYSGRSGIELQPVRCSEEDGTATLGRYLTRNESFEVIDRYGQPLRVVKVHVERERSSCVDGGEGRVEFEVSAHPRDGSAAGPALKFGGDGEHAEVLQDLNWPLLRATRFGCCASEDGYVYFDPYSGRTVATASTDPLPLQVINHAEDGGKQGSVWRYAFGLGSTSTLFDSSGDGARQVAANIVLAGPDSASQVYVLRLPAPAGSEGDGDGPWSVRELSWQGPGINGGDTLWIKGGPPVAAQVDGVRLRLRLECQCEAAPIEVELPVKQDRLVTGDLGQRGLRLDAQ